LKNEAAFAEFFAARFGIVRTSVTREAASRGNGAYTKAWRLPLLAVVSFTGRSAAATKEGPMSTKKEPALARGGGARNRLEVLRQMTSDFDRLFAEPGWPLLGWPVFRTPTSEPTNWLPGIDVFEKDNRVVTKIDLPGLKKEDVKVEVTDGRLTISGERKTEAAEEKKENFYRCEREYGSFYRAVPLPDGVTFEDIKATFADGVLEVSFPVPAKAEAKVRRVEIEEGKAPKAA
jgi:HSP20 family protein